MFPKAKLGNITANNANARKSREMRIAQSFIVIKTYLRRILALNVVELMICVGLRANLARAVYQDTIPLQGCFKAYLFKENIKHR